jgi:DNA polymerase III alpha subunit
MQGRSLETLSGMILDQDIDIDKWPDTITDKTHLFKQTEHDCTPTEFHAQQQKNWHMPETYKTLDIAEHVLNLCKTQAELQRCGQELLLYQEKNLFDLLRYLKYLVDTMTENRIIWGVGRGSSVASFVLYKLGVHRIDSLYYNLDIREFLR